MHPSLGRTGKDKITGFSGIITGYVQYVTGCNQFLLMPKVDKDGKVREGQWYDEQRVAVTGRPLKFDNAASPGPDMAAPKR